MVLEHKAGDSCAEAQSAYVIVYHAARCGYSYMLQSVLHYLRCVEISGGAGGSQS